MHAAFDVEIADGSFQTYATSFVTTNACKDLIHRWGTRESSQLRRKVLL